MRQNDKKISHLRDLEGLGSSTNPSEIAEVTLKDSYGSKESARTEVAYILGRSFPKGASKGLIVGRTICLETGKIPTKNIDVYLLKNITDYRTLEKLD